MANIGKAKVVIISGGLDSTTLLYYLHSQGQNLIALSFIYGQQHVKEIEYATYHAKKLKVPHYIVNLESIYRPLQSSSALLGGMDIPTIHEVIGDPQPITYVPFRNTLMLTVAAAYAEGLEANEVCYGAQKHDEYSGYWDTTNQFVSNLQSVFNLNRRNKVQITAPFVDKSKSDLVLIGTKLGIDYAKTLTCYSGTNCATCPTCSDRIMAFKRAGLIDPIKYQVKP